MNKQQAQQMIRETFEGPFDRRCFTGFIKNFLNKITEDSFIYQGQYIPDSYKGFITKYIRLGKFNDGENRIDILIVYLTQDTSIERARSRQRNFVAGYLQGKYGSTNNKNAALVAFVSPGKRDWRFSLVKLDYMFKPREDGIPKAVEEFTPARRWSFLVGANEGSHTAQSRLLSILENDEQAPTLQEIEKAFDIETVTKEFFLKYRELFLRTKEELDKVIEDDSRIKADFEAKSVDTVNFAKKLLGQIIFLYFLQKKGWFGVDRDDDWGSGSKHFLRELFEKRHSDYRNFYNDILEPLFYEALRIDRSHDDGYYSRFNCKIPFLNGGLFDPIGNYDWVHTDMIIPDKLFSNANKTKEGDTGDGILDIFDRYNFTVKEDEPMEREVAIDPELLGKAYEKFNAIRPDNYAEFKKALKSGRKGEENKFNKKFGVYYTPREIVHYMCQQSLINYLATELESKVEKEAIEFLILEGAKYIEHLRTAKDKKEANENYRGDYKEKEHFVVLKKHASEIDTSLSEIRVCDPAVGSGAFPVGMMTEIVKCRMFLVETGCLENIYTDSCQEEAKRTTYNYKRDCIEHSLYGVDIDPGAVEIAKLRLWLSLVVDEEDIKSIKPLPNLDYRVMQGNSLIELLSAESLAGTIDHKRTELVKELKISKDELLNITIPAQKENRRREIDILIKQLFEYDRDSQIRRLEDSILAIESQERLFEDDRDKKGDQKKIREIAAKIEEIENIDAPAPTEHFEWNVNYSEVFEEKGGFDVVIANPPYNAKLNDNERKVYKAKYESVKTGRQDTAAIFVELARRIGNSKSELSYILPYRLFSRKRNHGQFQIYTLHNYSIMKILYLGSNIGFTANDEFMILIMTARNISPNKIDIAFKPNIDQLHAIRFYGVDQDIFVERSEINLNLAKVDLSLISKIEEGMMQLGVICHIKDGIIPFLREKLISERKVDDRYVQFAGIAGRYTLQKYCFRYDDLYLCYDINEARIYIEDPIELRKVQLREKQIFLHRKVLTAQNSAVLKGAIDEEKIFVSNSLHSTYLREKYQDEFALEYILALVNSNLINYYHNSLRLKATDLHPQILISNLRKLPVKNVSLSTQEPFIDLVDNILAITQSRHYQQSPQKQAKVKALGAEIDQLVYKLYDLTPEEIKIVESSS